MDEGSGRCRRVGGKHSVAHVATTFVHEKQTYSRRLLVASLGCCGGGGERSSTAVMHMHLSRRTMRTALKKKKTYADGISSTRGRGGVRTRGLGWRATAPDSLSVVRAPPRVLSVERRFRGLRPTPSPRTSVTGFSPIVPSRTLRVRGERDWGDAVGWRYTRRGVRCDDVYTHEKQALSPSTRRVPGRLRRLRRGEVEHSVMHLSRRLMRTTLKKKKITTDADVSVIYRLLVGGGSKPRQCVVYGSNRSWRRSGDGWRLTVITEKASLT